MPYMTNPAYAPAANNLVRAFVGSADDDAAIARSQLYQTQAQKLQGEVAQRDALAALYEGAANRPAGESIQQYYDRVVPSIAGGMIRAGYDKPDMATVGSLLPGLNDEQRSRNYMAAGHSVGKDDFFSEPGRNSQQVIEVGTGQRAVRGDGSEIIGAHPSAINALDALVNQRNAATAKASGRAGANKIPKMGSTETELALGALMKAFGYDDQGQFFSDLNSDPNLSTGMYNAMEQGWNNSGGNTAAAIAESQKFLNAVPQAEDPTHWYNPLSWLDDVRRFEGAKAPGAAPVQTAPAPGGAQAAPAIRPGTKAINKATGQTLTFNGQEWVP